ncbi:hypothetical protein Y032_0068g219 [Ancylostoma ceylanicum]|nr:hypothetical protein Y032_0068g219 [Ancylostoma ceylanicum]
MPSETAQAICSVLMGNILLMFPRLRFCFAHGGGAYPIISGRVAHGYKMSAPKSVGTACVIGAGVSGLTAIKHLLEFGMDVVCFEKSKHIGGLWRYNEEDGEGYGSVMKNTILNTSKEFVTFSDFSMDPSLPNFMPNQLFYGYLVEYAKHFDLEKHIQFGTAVKSVSRAPNYEATGEWTVTTERNDTIQTATFFHVMICIGHHVYPYKPTIDGDHLFSGTFSHSHDYKDFKRFTGRRVLVVGLGNSGGDIACELARVAKQVYCSTRHGTWVNRRVVNRGYPRDVIMRTRHYEMMQKLLPGWLRSYLALSDYNNFMDHELYGLRPRELPGQSPVLLADDMPLYLSSGFIKIRPGISHFAAGTVHFDDGSCEKIDDVIYCTGYDFDFHFIEDGKVIEVRDNQVQLWKRIFPPQLRWNSLAVIGLVDPLGPTTTTCEMQARTVAHMWTQRINCPSKDEMLRDIRAEKEATAMRYRCSARKASLQVDFINYMDQLARVIGCVPGVDWKMFLKDPKLAFMLYFGPVTPLHYRLSGPKDRAATRDQIVGTFDRVHLAMRPHSGNSFSSPIFLLVCNPYFITLCGLAIPIISVLICLFLMIW